MSSVSRQFSQPLTKTFVAHAVGYSYTLAVIEAKLLAADANYVKLGNVYLLSTKAAFEAFLDSNDIGGSAFAQYETLIDMGREIHVGVAGINGNLLTFRTLKRTNGQDLGSSDVTGFVIVANMVSKDSIANTSGYFLVKVARV